MASTALSQQNHPTPSETLQRRMDQFLSMATSLRQQTEAGEDADHHHHHHHDLSSSHDVEAADRDSPPPFGHHSSRMASDPYHYQEASVTSGSNSGGEEDEREMGEGGKRLAGHLNGFASKKRRKQTKPTRIGAGEEVLPGSQGGQLSEDGGGPASSPEQGEYRRVSSGDDDNDMEEGERRPGHFVGEFPLNLSSSKDKGPTLRVLGVELLQQHPNSSSSSEDSAGKGGRLSPSSLHASLYPNMLPFGLPPFAFPFTGGSGHSQNAMKAPASTSSAASLISTTSRSQIFNPEAYCELCNKEFCNKYFLKTHKANKHGIYSDTPTVSRSPGPAAATSNNVSTSLVSSSGNGGQVSGGSSGADHVGPLTPNSQAGSPFSGAFIAANMGSLRPPFLPLSPGASPSPTSNSLQQQQQQALRQGDTGNNSHLPSNASQREPGEISGQMTSPGLSRQSAASSVGLISPRELSSSEFRQSIEERERLMLEHSRDKENGEVRKSLESPRPSMGGLSPHLSNFNAIMFGGIPSLESLRKEEEMRKVDHTSQSGSRASMTGLSAGNVATGGSPAKGHFSSDKLRQMGVINADAFCEICCKEFCNKYFLRVHKLKKHGICSPDLPPEKVQKILNQMAKEAGKTGNPPPAIIRPSHMLVSSGTNAEKIRPCISGVIPIRPLASASVMKSLVRDEKSVRDSSSDGDIIKINDDSNDGGKESLAKEGNESVCSEPREASEHGHNPAEAASEDLQRLQSMIMELNSKNKIHISGSGGGGGGGVGGTAGGGAAVATGGGGDSSSVCKVCNKDMENKYFLRAHMMNEHGVLHMDDMPHLTLANKASSEAGHDRAEHHLMNGDFGGGEHGSQLDLATKFLQQMQKGLLPAMDTNDERSFLERVKAELASSPKKMDKDPNRKPASLSRSYCEICKKELCNKYFMKTHMLKMHGINIEGPSSGMMGSSNSNSSGGAGGGLATSPVGSSTGVVCQICKKELCSKYFLKVHMQNSHGLNEDGTPYAPSIKENGGLFGGLFPLTAPPPELLSLASTAPTESEHYFSRLLGEQSEISRERLKEMERQKLGSGQQNHTCSLCGEAFPEIVALQVHIIKSHGAFPPESGIFGKQPGSPSAPSPGEVEKAGKPGEQLDMSRPCSTSPKSTEPADDCKADRAAEEASSLPGSKAVSSSGNLLHPSKASSTHIEMLQRHMLSQQFPGLINPLLSGFSGFNQGSSSQLAFSSPLHHLFGGNGKSEREDDEIEEGERIIHKLSASEHQNKKSIKPMMKSKRFKCSKCSKKFHKRELCLRHIHEAHSVSKARKLAFSPHKKSGLLNSHQQKVRSNYVRQLMELLRVPTSRGTPQKSPDKNKGEHIMQAFLLKTPKASALSNKTEERDDNDDDENHNNEGSAEKDYEGSFVPSVVYLPVSRRISEPLTIAFSLTPT